MGAGHSTNSHTGGDRKARRQMSKENFSSSRQYPSPKDSNGAQNSNNSSSNYLQLPSYYNHLQYQQQHSNVHLPGSYSPPCSKVSSNTSSLQKAFSRRRSSNHTVDSQISSHCSTLVSTPNSTLSSRYSGESAGGGQLHDDHDFRWQHGRRYHNTSSLYMLPNDTEEVDRLHLQHYIFKMIFGGKNIHVPIPKDSGRVIDLGCGPATWTMDMATDLTSIHFVGIDLSPIYPTAIHPRNCSFYKENILDGVSQSGNCFDVAYQRNVAPGFTLENWQQSIQEAYRILKPGGWFESVESDVSIQGAGSSTKKCYEHMRLSMAPRNVDPSVVRSLNRIMIETGFTDVQVKEYHVPLGEWGGKLGQLWRQNIFSIMETVKPHLAQTGHTSEAQVSEMMQAMYKETQELQSYQVIYVTYGRKPI